VTPPAGPSDHAPSLGDRVRDAWLTSLALNAEFDRPWVEAAAAWAVAAVGAAPERVVDVGCGAGGAAIAFGQQLRGADAPSNDDDGGPAPGVVVAVDPDPRLVAVARQRALDAGVADRLQLAAAAIGGLPVPAGTADVVWASGVVHHVPDQQAAVDELAGLLRPGGVLALVEGGLPLRCLPHDVGVGRPGLEARLDEARARWFTDLRAELGGPVMPYGWPEALARAGLEEVRVRSFVAESSPPLGAVGRQVAIAHLESALSELGDRLAPDDRATVAHLLDSEGPAWVGRRDDLVVTAVRTVLLGTAPGPR
jgi:SAM-dependent methyltransferase